jgi:hypothetical protein
LNMTPTAIAATAPPTASSDSATVSSTPLTGLPFAPSAQG